MGGRARDGGRQMRHWAIGLLVLLMTGLAGVAYAKTLNGTVKDGVLSADGKTFYVVGQTSTAVKDADGNQIMLAVGDQQIAGIARTEEITDQKNWPRMITRACISIT